MDTLVIKVKGMECTGCEKRIQNSLKTINGILEVNADHEKGLVFIKLNLKVDKDLIYKKIQDLGFEVEK